MIFQPFSDIRYEYILRYTPYDKKEEANQDSNANATATGTATATTEGSHQSDAAQVSPQSQSKFSETNLSYDISDEKLLTAAAQLVDVYNKRSKAAATITLQKKPTAEPRIRSLNAMKASPRPPFNMPIPNFVVTKITEKSRTNTPECKTEKVVWSSASNKIKSSDGMAELRNPRTIHQVDVFQKSNQAKKLFDLKDYRVKGMSISNKPAGNSEQNNAIETKESNQNEPVILNFRAQMHSSPSSKSKPPMTLNGRTNANPSHRPLEKSPSCSKNSMKIDIMSPRTINRYYVNKSLPNSINRPVKPMYTPKVYSRASTNLPHTLYQCHEITKTVRAPIVKLWPSMLELDKANRPCYRAKNDAVDRQNASHPIESALTCDASSNLKRYNSAIEFGTKKSNKLFDTMVRNNKEYYRLFDLCSDVISRLCIKGRAVRRKRGRPKKKIYQNHTKELLNSPDFSIRADIFRLNELPYSAIDQLAQNRRRSKRFALLSIEPVLPDIEAVFSKNRDRERDQSPVNTFQNNRGTLKTYSRANLTQSRVALDCKRNEATAYNSKPQIQLLNIEPLSSTSEINLQENINNEVTQSTEYIIGPDLSIDDADECDVLYIEYLEDNDEIESPAYEPHISETLETKPSMIITEEADTTFETKFDNSADQQMNWDPFHFEKSLDMAHNPTTTTTSSCFELKKSSHIEIKYLKANESDAHSTTDSISELFSVCDHDDASDFGQANALPSKKTNISISPVRKSTRKRKIPSEFPNFAKKIRG